MLEYILTHGSQVWKMAVFPQPIFITDKNSRHVVNTPNQSVSPELDRVDADCCNIFY